MNKNIFLTFFLFNFLGASSISDFSFEQSSNQAFYFFNQVLVDGKLIEPDDWVVAYKQDVCVGSRQWDLSQCGGNVCDVPVMGDDGTVGTNGYMLAGETPDFKVFDFSEGELVDMDFYNYYSENIENPEWSNLKIISFSQLINQDYSFSDASDFEHTATMAVVFTNDDYTMSGQDILAGYFEDQVISISNASTNSIAGGYIFFSSIFLNGPASGLSFLYYNYENKLIFNTAEAFNVNINDNIGDALDPVILTINDSDLNVSESINLINDYAILNTYPNPFNPIINIDLNLKENEYLNISIFNMNGKKIATIFEGYQLSGKYNYKWDAFDIPSGIYFVVTNKTNVSDVLMEKICLIK